MTEIKTSGNDHITKVRLFLTLSAASVEIKYLPRQGEIYCKKKALYLFFSFLFPFFLCFPERVSELGQPPYLN